MGFDLHGKSGNSFRKSVWDWPLLWGLVCQHSGDVLSAEQKKYGYYNDGARIEREQALKIAKCLRKLYDKTSTSTVEPTKSQQRLGVERDMRAMGAPIPQGISLQELSEFADFAERSEGFTID
jgi:hypothetical protein